MSVSMLFRSLATSSFDWHIITLKPALRATFSMPCSTDEKKCPSMWGTITPSKLLRPLRRPAARWLGW